MGKAIGKDQRRIAETLNMIKPKAGIVIVNYITSQTTVSYVNDSLLKQEDVDLIIVIVDNGSPEESIRVLEDAFTANPAVHLINKNENRGYGAGCNAGILFLDEYDCDYIIISNNDIVLDDSRLIFKMTVSYCGLTDPCFIAPIMFENRRASVEYSAWKSPGRMSEILNSTFMLKLIFHSFLKRYLYRVEYGNNQTIKVDCLAGSFFMGAGDIFKTIGYFDENAFLYYEENIMAVKVHRAQLNNYLVQDCRYHHLHAHTIDSIYSLAEKFRKNFKSKIYYWKNYRYAGIGFLAVLKILFSVHQFELFVYSIFRKRKTAI
jgi:GT2 family glycosyltransferase